MKNITLKFTIILFLIIFQFPMNLYCKGDSSYDETLRKMKWQIQKLEASHSSDSAYLHQQEIMIAELKAARDQYTNNIQFYSILIAVCTAILTIIIALVAIFAPYFTLKNIKKQIYESENRVEVKTNNMFNENLEIIDTFKKEYLIDKNEINEIFKITLQNLTIHQYSFSLETLNENEYILYLNFVLPSIIFAIRFIVIIGNEEDNKELIHWVKITKRLINDFIETFHKIEYALLNRMIDQETKAMICNYFDLIINLKSNLFILEFPKIKEIKERFEKIPVSDNVEENSSNTGQ
jgi:hypothetical protein